MRGTTYAAMSLGKIPISTGRAWRRMLLMAYTCYGGCVLGLLLLASCRKELGCGRLQIGIFLEVPGLIPT
jgi:hypothetical protein